MAAAEQVAFEWAFPETAEAQRVIGRNAFVALQHFTNVRPLRDIEGTVRWDRAMLVAARRALEERGWLQGMRSVEGPVLESGDFESP